MQTYVTRSFTFEASHVLAWHKGKCSQLHGHGYKIEVTVGGRPDADGIVIDFDKLADIVDIEVIAKLDHAHLNDAFENPTAENIAAWVFERLEEILPGLARVRLFETSNSWVEVVAGA